MEIVVLLAFYFKNNKSKMEAVKKENFDAM
jgi:hypothetical protein